MTHFMGILLCFLWEFGNVPALEMFVAIRYLKMHQIYHSLRENTKRNTYVIRAVATRYFIVSRITTILAAQELVNSFIAEPLQFYRLP